MLQHTVVIDTKESRLQCMHDAQGFVSFLSCLKFPWVKICVFKEKGAYMLYNDVIVELLR